MDKTQQEEQNKVERTWENRKRHIVNIYIYKYSKYKYKYIYICVCIYMCVCECVCVRARAFECFQWLKNRKESAFDKLILLSLKQKVYLITIEGVLE